MDQGLKDLEFISSEVKMMKELLKNDSDSDSDSGQKGKDLNFGVGLCD